MGLQYTSPMGFMQVYRDLLSLIMSVGSVDTNQRTGVKIKPAGGTTSVFARVQKATENPIRTMPSAVDTTS